MVITRKNSILRWVLRLVALPPLATWLLIRLWVPWGAELPTETLVYCALGGAALLLALFGVFGLTDKLLLPWGKWWQNLLTLPIPLLLGWFFDISLAMPTAPLPDQAALTAALPLSPALFPDGATETLCHAGNALVFTVIVLALLKAGRELKGVGKVNRLQIIVIFVVLNLVTALYAFTSKAVYSWDTTGYWFMARDMAQAGPSYDQLLAVLETTLTLDYNHLLAWPISLVMGLFGGSRTVFLFAIANLYIFPGLWGLTAMANGKRWSGLVLSGLFPILSYTGLVGFVDVACCALGIWAILIYTSDRPAVSRGIFTGALLVATFLLRRYFVFFAASFGLAAFVLKPLYQRKNWWDFLALVCSTAICAVTFTLRFLLDKVLAVDYSDIYSAYDLGRFYDFISFCRYFGMVPLILFLAAALVDMAQKEDRPRMTFGLVQVIACFVAFVSVQSHGQQHVLLYLPALAFLALNALSRAPQYMSSLLAMSIAVYCFFPKVQPTSLLDVTTPDIFPSYHFYGPTRDDIDELIALADYVDSLSEHRREPMTATVLASSFIFNGDTLANVWVSLDLPEPENRTRLQYHGTVDKRDAFNWNTAFSDYLIVGDLIQTHLGAENQQVMVILAQHILDGTGPGRNYRELPVTFHLTGGVTVRLFRRTQYWDYEDYHAISDPLKALYPNHADQYEIPDWVLRSENRAWNRAAKFHRTQRRFYSGFPNRAIPQPM